MASYKQSSASLYKSWLLGISLSFFETIPIEIVKYLDILLALCSICKFSISFLIRFANSTTFILSKAVIIPNSSPPNLKAKSLALFVLSFSQGFPLFCGRIHCKKCSSH